MAKRDYGVEICGKIEEILQEAGVFVDDHIEETINHLCAAAADYLEANPPGPDEEEKTWDVLVTCDCTESALIRVTAVHEGLAKERALDKARWDENIHWEPDEGNIPEPYVADEDCVTEVSGSSLNPLKAEVGWYARDLVEIARERKVDLSPEKAEALLDNCEDDLQNAMIERGNKFLRNVIDRHKESQK
jgi:hypothetical protein